MNDYVLALTKLASKMDNQPEVQPPKPQASDSHLKRNVALGAALLVGGALGAKPIMNAVKGQSGLASTIAKQQQMKSTAFRAGKATANKLAPAKSMPAPGLADKGRALAGHYVDKAKGVAGGVKQKYYKMKAEGVARDLQSERDKSHAEFLKGTGHEPAKAKGLPLRKRLAYGAAGGAVIGAGAIAGASGASKAHEPQDSHTPGA